jgi:hypothetical protein
MAELSTPARVLFELIDERLDYHAKQIRNRVFSEYRDLPWTHEQRKTLQPLVRKELEWLVTRILEICDNIGGVIPDTTDGTIGYTIRNVYVIDDSDELDIDEIEEHVREGSDIRTEHMDYADLWRHYLIDKQKEQC